MLKERNKLEETKVLVEITAAQEKLKIAEITEMLYENKQQRSKTIKQVSSRPITNLGLSTSYLAQNNEERQTNILDVHQSTQYRPKDKTYRSPTHTQYIVTHQPTRIHRKRKFQLNRNEPANLIKVTYRPKVLILS